MTRRLLLASVALVALFGTACEELAKSLTAEDFAIATLVNVPEQEDPATKQKVPGLVTFQLFFGRIDKSKITTSLDGSQSAGAGAFTGAAGAQVKLQFTDAGGVAREINVSDKGGGTYQIDSQTATLLTYAATDYVAQIAFGGRTYRLTVKAPEKAGVAEFATSAVKEWEAGKEFAVTRLNAQGPARNPVAFVDLTPIANGTRGSGWSNAPKDALAFFQFALADDAWRADAFKIPGAQFQKGNAYAVTLTSLERGGTEPGSPALFLGSVFLAGVASGGGVVVP
jgi:hypothetical protein